MSDREHTIRSQDQQFVRRLAILLVVWTGLFLLASAALVRYGDALMQLFA